MKIRMKSAKGSPVAAAFGDFRVNGANGLAGSPLLVAAAAPASWVLPPISRRLNAAAVHISGAAAGASPLPPVCSQSSKPRPIPFTDPPAAGVVGDAVIDGAWAATGPIASSAGVDARLSFAEGSGAGTGAGAGAVDAVAGAFTAGRGVGIDTDGSDAGTAADTAASDCPSDGFDSAPTLVGEPESPRRGRRVGAAVCVPSESRTVG
jgi:hypothetical protein